MTEEKTEEIGMKEKTTEVTGMTEEKTKEKTMEKTMETKEGPTVRMDGIYQPAMSVTATATALLAKMRCPFKRDWALNWPTRG